MALGVVTIGILSYLVVHRPAPPAFDPPRGEGASTTSTTMPTTTAAAALRRVLVIGDGLSAEAEGWPQLVAGGYFGPDSP